MEKKLREYDLTNLLKTIAGVGGSQLPPEHIGYYGSHKFCLAKKNKYNLQMNLILENAQQDLNEK